MSKKIIGQSVHTVDISDVASPADSRQFAISGSPSAKENRTYDVGFFSDRVQLNRVLKKRYGTYLDGGFSPAIPCHVSNVVELLAQVAL